MKSREKRQPESYNVVNRFEADRSLVQHLLTEQFPQWRDLDIDPVALDGWDNTTFRLGRDMLVRLPSAQCYEPQVEKEQKWLPKLAPALPLAISVPVAMGRPGCGYPWNWSVYEWLEGEPAAIADVDDRHHFAETLAHFLLALHRAAATGGPAPGLHNFFRGGPLSFYDAATRDAIASLHDKIDSSLATEVWEAALETSWNGAPVWVHGDVHASNLLVWRGRLSGVIDFGCCGVGDPACDLTIAWTFFSGDSRERFRKSLPLDSATWGRARGWALWRAVITLLDCCKFQTIGYDRVRRVIEDVLADHQGAD